MKKQITNPYLPSWEYVPDGEPHVFGDRLYIYGSHDKFGGKQFCENDYVCWSAPIDDLSDWKYEGVIYRKDQDPKNKIIKSTMYAPDVCQGNDGRYYLYYGLNLLPFFGVAVCDTPCGKFEFYGHVRHADGKLYGHKKGDYYPFDPGVINDNGKVYLYSGFSPANGLLRRGVDMLSKVKGANGNQVVELMDDMITVKNVKPLIPGTDNSKGTGFEGHEFYEASSIRKFKEKYYLIYSSVLSHELAYAISDFPDKGFHFGGSLHSNADIGYRGNAEPLAYWGNNHGSVAYIKGKYYIFAHRQTNYRECNRQGVAEEIVMNEDGMFSMAEMTSCGLNGKPLTCGKYEAGVCCNLFAKEGAEKSVFFTSKRKTAMHPCITQTGKDRENDPCQYIHNMRDGSTAGFKYFECDSREFKVRLRGDSGKLHILFDLKQNPVSTIELLKTDFIKEYSVPLHFDGKKSIYLQYEGDGSIDIFTIELA